MGQLVKVLNHRPSRVVLARETRDGGVLKIDELELQGGANNVDDARLALFAELPTVKPFFETGLLVVEGAVAAPTDDTLPKHGGDLSKLKLKAALNAIKACKDPRQLRLWVNQDGRPEVRDALIARHTELNKGDETPIAEDIKVS